MAQATPTEKIERLQALDLVKKEGINLLEDEDLLSHSQLTFLHELSKRTKYFTYDDQTAPHSRGKAFFRFMERTKYNEYEVHQQQKNGEWELVSAAATVGESIDLLRDYRKNQPEMPVKRRTFYDTTMGHHKRDNP